MVSAAISKTMRKVKSVLLGADGNQLKYFADSIAEFDLLSVALAGMENFNNGGDDEPDSQSQTW